MSLSTTCLMLVLATASPRGKAAVQHQERAGAPLGLAFDLTLSLSSRPERSQGGADLLVQLGGRAAYLYGFTQRSGLVIGGELAVRAFLPDSDGSSLVYSEIFGLNLQTGGLVGWRLASRNLSLVPHLSLGLSNGLALVHLKSPGSEAWRPRYLPGPYLGTGVMGSFFMALLRLDVALAIIDGRPEYRFDTGIGVVF